MSQDEAGQKFYKDIEEEYDDSLGFESKLDKLRSEIFTINASLNSSRAVLFAQPLVGLSLQWLLSKGLVEANIVELADILFEGSPGNSTRSSKDTNKESLIEDLKKYGNIKSTVDKN